MKEYDLHKIAQELRKDIVEMAYNANSSHVGSALSIIDILTVSYYTININVKNFSNQDRDKFILSKGHAVSALYAILAKRGFIDKELLETYCMDESPLSGHPKKNSIPGIEASTGSLGHGLSMGCGLALSDKNDNRKCKTIILMGDGECNEGSIWEAAMFAATQNLNNLIVIVDNNNLQGLCRTTDISGLSTLGSKWEAFGWNVREIDGHNFIQIQDVLSENYEGIVKPTVIIAHTIKGKGIFFMEDKLEWHYKSPNRAEYEYAMEALK